MKILHVSSGDVFGGIESILVSLARYGNHCPGMEHHFALCSEGRLSEELRALQAPVYLLGDARLSRPFRVRRARNALRSVIERSGCEVAVCHGPRTLICFAPALRARRLPVAWWVHGVKPPRHYLNFLLGRVLPDLAICCSAYRQQGLNALFPSVASTVIHAPIGPAPASGAESARSEVRQELDTPGDAVVMLLAGRMVPRKGHRQLIDALAELKAIDSWYCWIIGGPQVPREAAYFAELQSRVLEAGLGHRIRFTGQRSDVARIMAAADLYCQPNERGESFAIVFIEAMQAGLPVVTAALGGALEAIDGNSGMLVRPNDHRAWVDALRMLLTDPVLRGRLGSGGPARAQQLCDPRSRLEDLHAALGTLLGGRHSGGS